MEPSDVTYECLCQTMATTEQEDEYFYRIFPLPLDRHWFLQENSLAETWNSDADYILLREAQMQISRGTTGLSCWQVS